jgi:large subunit ribosomal protein L25
MAKTRAKVVLEVTRREETGTNVCRQLRARERVPGNVYGLDRPPFMVSVDPRRIDELLHLGSGVNTIFSLTLSGESRTREAMIKELQRDPVSERLLHIDFVRVDPDKAIHVRVPVHLVGSPEGVRNEGGILDFVHREVEVECLPGDIPEHVDLDVTALHINQHVSVSDLRFPEGVRVLADPNQIVAGVVAPRAEEVPAAEAPATEAAPAEPEVVKKGKAAEPPAAEGTDSGKKS